MKFDGLANELLRTVGKPQFIYGTAWKKDETTRLVKEALSAGFTAIDTAAQPRHYREELVGKALRETINAGTLKREDIFLQTKFTSPTGQDKASMPYDPHVPLEQQIHSSVASSLQNLRPAESLESLKESYVDCLLLHSPLRTLDETIVAWKLLETYVPHNIRSLGISNTNYDTLRGLYQSVNIPPATVQNRFHAETGYDTRIREFCAEKGIVYESFWTLTGNPKVLASEPVQKLSRDAGVSKEVAMYALVMELGIAPLNGTTNASRMKQDLEDVTRVKNWTHVYAEKWDGIVAEFKRVIEGS